MELLIDMLPWVLVGVFVGWLVGNILWGDIDDNDDRW